mgnify:CR=1 FL=1
MGRKCYIPVVAGQKPVIAYKGKSAGAHPGLAAALPADLIQGVSRFTMSARGQVTAFTLDGTEVRLGGKERLDQKNVGGNWLRCRESGESERVGIQ